MQDEGSRPMSSAPIIRPRAMSTPIRVERRSADRDADLQADRSGLPRRRTDQACDDGGRIGCTATARGRRRSGLSPFSHNRVDGLVRTDLNRRHPRSRAIAADPRSVLGPERLAGGGSGTATPLPLLTSPWTRFWEIGRSGLPAEWPDPSCRTETTDVATTHGAVSRGSPSPDASCHRPPAGSWLRGLPAASRQVPPRPPLG